MACDLAVGRFRILALVDTFNLLDSNRSLAAYDISRPLFPLRAPLDIRNPRVIRPGLRLNF